MKIAIIGQDGLLGSTIVGAVPKKVQVVEPIVRVDITDERNVKGGAWFWFSDVVINCAAMTNLDACEERPDEANAVNGVAAGTLAREARARGVRFVHISSDAVFDGVDGEHDEEGHPVATSAYGKSKLLGELRVMENDPNALIVRVSHMFGYSGEGFTGKNFASGVLRRLEGSEVVHADPLRSVTPTFVTDAAQRIVQLVLMGAKGVWHVASRGHTTWFE